ncbi:MAG: porin [Candidatus Omnitrophota bacterium]
MVKSIIILLTIYMLGFFDIGYAQVGQIQELKEQIKGMEVMIETLKTRVQELEDKQKAQDEQVGKISQLEESVGELQEPGPGFFEGVKVGGHFKAYLFDRSQGKRNAIRQHNNLSAGIHHLYLYFRKELEDWFSIDLQTDTSVTASATPSLGSNITRATSASVSTSIHQAFMNIVLPNNSELKVGLFHPMFSEDYANEIWWDQLYHQNKGLDYLQSWYDMGVEFYKNFDFENWSLPVYLSYLNGNTAYRGQFVDNNEGKTVLIHLAPEFFQSKLKLLGSFALGKHDVDNNDDLRRYAAGFDWKYKKFSILGEYLYSKWENLSLTGGGNEDGTRDGYYIKALYRFSPKWRGLIQYSHSELYNTAGSVMRSDIYDALTLGANYFLTEGSTIIAQVSTCDANRSDDSETLEFLRYTLGWRITF